MHSNRLGINPMLRPIENTPENWEMAESASWILKNQDAMLSDLPGHLLDKWICLENTEIEDLQMQMFIFAYSLKKTIEKYSIELENLKKNRGKKKKKIKERTLRRIAQRKSESITLNEEEVFENFHFWQAKLHLRRLHDTKVIELSNVSKTKLFSFDKNERFSVKVLDNENEYIEKFKAMGFIN